jgi:hypothetical protein
MKTCLSEKEWRDQNNSYKRRKPICCIELEGPSAFHSPRISPHWTSIARNDPDGPKFHVHMIRCCSISVAPVGRLIRFCWPRHSVLGDPRECVSTPLVCWGLPSRRSLCPERFPTMLESHWASREPNRLKDVTGKLKCFCKHCMVMS